MTFWNEEYAEIMRVYGFCDGNARTAFEKISTAICWA
jgi:hypothetical protein